MLWDVLGNIWSIDFLIIKSELDFHSAGYVGDDFHSAGYVGDDQATASTLTPDGWLKTGDLCYFNDDGFLFIVDRLKELIKYKAYQVLNIFKKINGWLYTYFSSYNPISLS